MTGSRLRQARRPKRASSTVWASAWPGTGDVVFESTSPPPDGTRYEGRDAVLGVWGQMLATTPRARFSVEEQFSDGSGRAVVRWRYDWAGGHVRGVDIVRVRNGQLAESLAYVKG